MVTITPHPPSKPTVKDRALAVQDVLLCLVRKWWRPLVCLGVAVTMVLISVAILINGVILPLVARQAADLSQLGSLIMSMSALVGSLFPFVFARSWEKVKELQAQTAPPEDPPF